MKAIKRKSRHGKIKSDKLDRVFSKLVRERAGWRCERCGTQYEPHAQGLHCSHIFSRRCLALRWHPSNAVAHCYACHMWYGGNPILGAEWARGILGSDAVAELSRVFHQYIPIKSADKLEILANLERSYDAMLSRRVGGKLGRIEFESPYPLENFGGSA